MRDVLKVLNDFATATLSVRVDGPPNHDGPRVIVEGDASGFRMLAEMLLAMAETVEADPAIGQHGWHLALSPADVPQLSMSDGSLLVLNCDADVQRVP